MARAVRHPRWPYRPPRNKRLAPEVYEEPGTSCFFTIRAYQKQSPFEQAARNHAVLKVLTEHRLPLNTLVLAYCLMPDHLHLLLTPRLKGASMLTFVDQFKGKSTARSWPTGWQGRLWQARYHDHVLRADEEFRVVAAYILENPIRKGMVERPEEYLWSGGIDRYGGWHVGDAYAEWAEWEERRQSHTPACAPRHPDGKPQHDAPPDPPVV